MSRRDEDSYLLTGRDVDGRRSRLGLPLIALMFAAIALLVLSRLDHSYVRAGRAMMIDALSPVLAAVQVPVEPVRWLARRVTLSIELADDFERLQRDVQELESWKWRARELERQLADLAQLNRVALEPTMSFVTARVVATSTGAFAQSAVIASGRMHGLRVGYPVVSGDGLVGRVVEAGETAARVLLLTDPMSRVPVHIGTLGTRAVMVGDNSATPRLAHLSAAASVKPGEAVFTSGVGGVFPRGLRIGEVVETAHGPAVRPRAALDALEYLSVLFHETPMLELTDRAHGDPRRRDVAGRAAPELAIPGASDVLAPMSPMPAPLPGGPAGRLP